MSQQLAVQDKLLPSEVTVLETLASKDVQWTQRELAHHTGYSIGLINTILKKLSRTGYIKIANVNKRRLQYLLTPQGFVATSKTACKYILRIFRDYRCLYEQVSIFFKDLYEEGYRDLHVSCDDVELCELIQVVIKDVNVASGITFHPAEAKGIPVVRLKGAAVTKAGPILDMAVQSQSYEGGVQ